MKYVKVLLVIGFSLFIFNSKVKAESFREGNYISNAYIKKIDTTNNNKTYYLQSQFIYKEDGNFVYCVDPFRKLDTSVNYSSLNITIASTLNITQENLNKILNAIYLGYGYGNHTDEIWYSITQVYIWRIMAPEAKIYFTSTLNGDETHMYDDKLAELDNLINEYYKRPDGLSTNIDVNYGDTLEIDIPDDYTLISSDASVKIVNGKLIINPQNLGKKLYTIKKGTNKSAYLYNDLESQRLLWLYTKPYVSYGFYVNVTSGKINLNFNYEDKYHSVCEDNLKNIYGLYDENNNLISEINLDENTNYSSDILNYGKYYVKQISHNCQYEQDDNTYEIDLNSSLVTKNIDVVEKYKTIHLEHNICTTNGCIPESDVTFTFENSNGVLSTTTDEFGNSSFNIGFGTYNVNQINGDENYHHYHDVLVNTSNYEEDDIYLIFNSYLMYADLKVWIKDEDDNLVDNALICIEGDENTLTKCYKSSNGLVTFPKLKIGTYKIYEKSIDNNIYILNSQVQSVDVMGNVEISIINLLKDKVRPTTNTLEDEEEPIPNEDIVVNNLINYVVTKDESDKDSFDNEFEKEEITYVNEENLNESEELIDNPMTNNEKIYMIPLIISLIGIIIMKKISKIVN